MSPEWLTKRFIIIEAQYLGGTNYKLAEKRATVVEETSPEEFPFATPPTPKPGGEEDTPIVPDKYEVEDGEGDTELLDLSKTVAIIVYSASFEISISSTSFPSLSLITNFSSSVSTCVLIL